MGVLGVKLAGFSIFLESLGFLESLELLESLESLELLVSLELFQITDAALGTGVCTEGI